MSSQLKTEREILFAGSFKLNSCKRTNADFVGITGVDMLLPANKIQYL